MYQEKRPTCVTVIGWAWIIIGGVMSFSATGILVASFVGYHISQAQPEAPQSMPIMFKVWLLGAVAQAAIGALGVVSGVNLLKLKSWSRSVLEILTWLLLVVIIGSTVFWVFKWTSTISRHEPSESAFSGAVVCVVIAVIYGIPLGWTLYYLRGRKVRSAMVR